MTYYTWNSRSFDPPIADIIIKKRTPRHAVCRIVLNLLSQVWGPLFQIRLGQSLSRPFPDIGSHSKSVGSKPVVLHHEHSRVTLLIP